MTNKDIALSVWRSGFIPDKNKVRQAAKESMRRLVALDLSSNIRNKAAQEQFLKDCGF